MPSKLDRVEEVVGAGETMHRLEEPMARWFQVMGIHGERVKVREEPPH
jgi:hypothetical protein